MCAIHCLKGLIGWGCPCAYSTFKLLYVCVEIGGTQLPKLLGLRGLWPHRTVALRLFEICLLCLLCASLLLPIATTEIQTFPPRTCLGVTIIGFTRFTSSPLLSYGMKTLPHETLKEIVHYALSMPSTPRGSGAAGLFPLPLLVGARSLARASRTGRVNETVPRSAHEPSGLLCPFLYLTRESLHVQACWKLRCAGLNMCI